MAIKKKRSAAEAQFLEGYDAAMFPHPSVTVDVALITVEEGVLQALLIKRSEHPDRGRWSLPGGFVQMDESLDGAAERVLADKTGVDGVFLEQLYTFGDPQRDPRTRVITVAYYALVESHKLRKCATDASDHVLAALRADWKGEAGGAVQASDDEGRPLPLAFDHELILGTVLKRLRGKLAYAPIGFELLPSRFTLRALQTIHESIIDRQLNKDSFRRRMLASGLVSPTGKYEEDVGHRPAELYRFKRTPSRSEKGGYKWL